MAFKSSVISAFSALCSVSLVKAAALDVWAPPITNPTATTVWTVGQNATVTWDTSSAPIQITNPNGAIHLRINNKTNGTTVASGFSILDGNATFIVPDVKPSTNYICVLFGDSGNWSPEFSIISSVV